MSQKYSHICLVMAMQGEAQPLIDKLQFEHLGDVYPNLPPQLYQTAYEELTLSLVLLGQDKRFSVDWVGTEPATLATQLAIDKLSPDLVISTGTAGGFASKGSDIGSIVASHGDFLFHDHDIPLPDFKESGEGRYPSLGVTAMATLLGFQSGRVSSGSSLRKTDYEVAMIDQSNAYAKDMESTAVAGICMLHNIPCFALRSITNLVDLYNESESEFIKNFDTAVESLTDALERVIEYINQDNL